MGLGALGVLGSGVVSSHAASAARATTTGRILQRSDAGTARAALVEYTPAGGASTTAWLDICHHQSYAVGNAIPVVYERERPGTAWEKGMEPGAVDPLQLAALAIIGGGVLVAARRIRLRADRRDQAPMTLCDEARGERDAILSAVFLQPDPAVEGDRAVPAAREPELVG